MQLQIAVGSGEIDYGLGRVRRDAGMPGSHFLDSSAVHLLWWNDDRPVAAARVVVLPTEAMSALPAYQAAGVACRSAMRAAATGPNVAELDSLAIVPSYRGMGLSTRLVWTTLAVVSAYEDTQAFYRAPRGLHRFLLRHGLQSVQLPQRKGEPVFHIRPVSYLVARQKSYTDRILEDWQADVTARLSRRAVHAI